LHIHKDIKITQHSSWLKTSTEIEIINYAEKSNSDILVRGQDRRSMMWCHGIVTALAVLINVT